MFYQTSNAKAVFDEVFRLSTVLTFAVAADELSDTGLVRAFQHHFEDAVFASFTIKGLSPSLQRVLTSCGAGIKLVDPYAERLLACPDLRASWPDLAVDQVSDALPPDGGVFDPIDPLMLEGHLAAALHHGGAYSHASAVDAVSLARDFVGRFVVDGYDDVVVITGPGWTNWWHQVTGDYAWLMTNFRTEKIHLLCASGAD